MHPVLLPILAQAAADAEATASRGGGILGDLTLITIGILLFILVAVVFFVTSAYQKVEQGKALIRNGAGGTKVSFTGMIVLPVVHKLEKMDITVRRVTVERRGSEGLICKDNMRADIAVDFFVRINDNEADVKNVATSIGCERASSIEGIRELFDAKFSEALKTVGKQFHFEELYTERNKFRDEIIKVIGTDLNGYVLEDAAIDYLEQTGLEHLNPNNILDAEGIKKITDRTSREKILANQIDQDRVKTITKQNVEAREAVLELEKQQAEAEEKQKREISVIRSREEAESKRVAEEQRLRHEQARIATEEELAIATENKDRQIIIAQKNKQRTDAIETERVQRDRDLEVVERQKVTQLADIEREKAVEVEKRNIQEVIKDRVMVEKTVVIEQEKIKDTEAFAGADRAKQVAITKAEQEAQEKLIAQLKAAEASKDAEVMKAEELFLTQVRAAEASKRSAELKAQELVVTAEAEESASQRTAEAKKNLASAKTAETAAAGLGEAQVLEAMAAAKLKEGESLAKSDELRYLADATGIKEKAEAMKIFDGVGREHEEFKLRLQKDKEIELASIEVNERIAEHQAAVLAEALKNTRVDIVGGSTDFYDRIVGAVTRGKSVDRTINSSEHLLDVKETFFDGGPEQFRANVTQWVNKLGLRTEDVRNLTLSALLAKLAGLAGNDQSLLAKIQEYIGIADKSPYGQMFVRDLLALNPTLTQKN
ncbi:MAG: flotillin family protein [Verrucomicrobiota bacterium JB022]|nr:flotillin family protein [Verrucomicrobiota bacterium JB022]